MARSNVTNTPTNTNTPARRTRKANGNPVLPQGGKPSQEQEHAAAEVLAAAMAAGEGVLSGTVLPVTTAEYQSAKAALHDTAKIGANASRVLREIVEAEAYDSYGFEDASALFADFLGDLALPGKLTTGDNLRICAELVKQGYKSEDIASMVGAAGKQTLTYVRAKAIEAGLLDAPNGNGDPKEKVNGGKAKVTDDGLIKFPGFTVTPENASKVVKYLAKLGVTVELPADNGDDSE